MDVGEIVIHVVQRKRAAYDDAIELHLTNKNELYKIDSVHPDEGSINRWGLCVDEEFIRIATTRAAELDFGKPEIFCVVGICRRKN